MLQYFILVDLRLLHVIGTHWRIFILQKTALSSWPNCPELRQLGLKFRPSRNWVSQRFVLLRQSLAKNRVRSSSKMKELRVWPMKSCAAKDSQSIWTCRTVELRGCYVDATHKWHPVALGPLRRSVRCPICLASQKMRSLDSRPTAGFPVWELIGKTLREIRHQNNATETKKTWSSENADRPNMLS